MQQPGAHHCRDAMEPDDPVDVGPKRRLYHQRMGLGRATSTFVRRLVALVIAFALLGPRTNGLAQPTDESAQEAAAPTLSLAPSEGRPGSTVTASGKGYCGSVILRWDDELQLTSGHSDERGDISIMFSVPRDATPGSHRVTSTSECSGTSASFNVVNAPPTTTSPPPTTTPSPPTTTVSPVPTAVSPPPITVPPPPTASGELPPGARVTTVPPLPTETGTEPSRTSPSTPGGASDSNKDSTLAQYEEIVKRELRTGVILYNPPDRMRVGVVNRIEVRISREVSDRLDKGLQGKADPRIEKLLVGTTMRAKLEGNSFDINLIGSDIQELASTGYREWRWDVTPTTSGDHPLFFTVSVLHEKYSNPIEEKVLERRIDVSINPGYSFLKLLSNNWEKFVAALVGIVGIIEAYRRLRRKNADDRSDGIAPGSAEN